MYVPGVQESNCRSGLRGGLPLYALLQILVGLREESYAVKETGCHRNGYRSLHLTIRLPVFFAEKEIHVPVEIQLRTIAMDFWASLEHTIRYKKNLPINAEVETELKECADSSREWDRKMEHLLHILT